MYFFYTKPRISLYHWSETLNSPRTKQLLVGAFKFYLLLTPRLPEEPGRWVDTPSPTPYEEVGRGGKK